MTLNDFVTRLFGPFESPLLPGGIRPVWSPAMGVDDYSQFVQVALRQLYLFSTIAEEDNDEENIAYILKALRMLDAVSSDPITIFINSPGGSIASGLALIQTMRDIAAPVHTFVIGEAASMAAVVAVAGMRRYAYPAARWLLHRGKGAAAGDAEDIAIAAKELQITDTYADQVVLNFSKIPANRLDKIQQKDFWLGAEEALKWGLVDEIVVPRSSPTADWKSWLPDARRLNRKLARFGEDDDKPQDSGSAPGGQETP